MIYLIIDGKDAFLTYWFDINNYVDGMIVIDLQKDLISFDGVAWKIIEEDSL